MGLPRKVQKSSINKKSPPKRRKDTSRMLPRNALRRFPVKLLWNHPHLGWGSAPRGGQWWSMMVHGGPLLPMVVDNVESLRILSVPSFIHWIFAGPGMTKIQVHPRWRSQVLVQGRDVWTLPQACYSWVHRPEAASPPLHERAPSVQGCWGQTEQEEGGTPKSGNLGSWCKPTGCFFDTFSEIGHLELLLLCH